MIQGHKIERKIEVNTFLDIVKQFTEDQIKTTDHTFFRLSQEQRKIFKERILKEHLLHDVPILVGIQYNRAYAAFYKHEKDVLKVIMEIQPAKINVITFYIVDKNQLPRI